ncbi:MAG: hypothetical protein ABFC80_09550 [Coriobacteriales bacterium]
MRTGRPSKYDHERHVPAVLALMGTPARWPDIAAACGVTIPTVKSWADGHEEFLAAVNTVKTAYDDAVEDAFHSSAIGGALKSRTTNRDGDVVETYYPPDTTAGIFWLCNRRPERWRHVQRVEHSGPDGEALSITALIRQAEK